MKVALTRWLERRWYGDAEPGLVLRGLSALFGRVACSRRQAYLSGRKPGERAGLPVIVVGNLAVGGAGKTPLTISLVEGLRARGFAPGVISRGYGRDDVSTVRRVSPDDDARLAGDEPLLIARRTRAPVAVAARRIDAARLLATTDEVDVLIADDGLQHYALARDVEILVVDGRRRFGNGRLLPAGPLREPLERAEACDFVVVNGGQAQDDEVPMRLELSQAVALHDGHAKPLAEFRGSTIHALAGIADPERFFSSLRGQGLDIATHAFADHHDFSASDLDFGDAAPVLMTEKDAVKCAAFARPGWYAVPVQAKLPESFFDAVAQRMRARWEASA